MRSCVLTLRGRAKRAALLVVPMPYVPKPTPHHSNSLCRRAVRKVGTKRAPFTGLLSRNPSRALCLKAKGRHGPKVMTYHGAPTKFQEPRLTKTQQGHRGASEARWRWWYSAIADAMIRNPDWTQQEIAVSLNKHPNTVSMIVGTDLFKEFFAQRKAAWMEDHDLALRTRLTSVATESLDIVLEQLKNKRSQVPLQAALKVVESSLDRLGYAPNSGPQVVVDNRQIDNRQQTLAVSPSDLEAARAAMRLAEQSKFGSSLAPSSSDNSVVLEACGVGQDLSEVEVPVTDSSP